MRWFYKSGAAAHANRWPPTRWDLLFRHIVCPDGFKETLDIPDQIIPELMITPGIQQKTLYPLRVGALALSSAFMNKEAFRCE